MQQIFSRAELVAAWVGSAEDDTAEAVKFLLERSLTKTKQSEGSVSLDASPSSRRPTASAELLQSQIGDYLPQESPRYSRLEKAKKRWMRNQWSIIQDFFDMIYWKRTWIIQEVAVATRLKVLYGCSEIEWKYVAAEILLWKETVMSLPTSHLSQLYAYHVSALRSHYMMKMPITLLEAMLVTSKAMATDPRDKIFALRGLTSDGPELIPTPDYSSPIQDVLIGLTKGLIAAEKTLDIICMRSLDRAIDIDMPSWIPPWFMNSDFSFLVRQISMQSVSFLPKKILHAYPLVSLRIISSIIQFFGFLFMLTTLQSNQMTILEKYMLMKRTAFSHVPIAYPDSSTLEVRGVVLDSIVALSSALGHASSSLLTDCEIEQCDDTDQDILVTNVAKFYPSGPKNALWQALCMDHAFHQTTGYPAVLEYNARTVAQFQSYFATLWSYQGRKAASKELQIWVEENQDMIIGKHTLQEWATLGVRRYRNDPVQFEAFCNVIEDILKSGMRLFVTKFGYLGMAPPWTRKGDRLSFLKGCSMPAMLRGNSSIGYRMIGPCSLRSKFEPYAEACGRFARCEEPLDSDPSLNVRQMNLV